MRRRSAMPCCPPRRVNFMWNLSNVETRRAGNASYQGPSLAVVVRAFWAIVGGLRSPKDEGGKSASGARQSRCDVGAV